MNLANQIVFWVVYISINIILIILLYLYFANKHKFQTFLKIATTLNVIIFLLVWVSQIISIYLVIKVLPFGQELIQGTHSFFIEKAINISEYYLLTAIATCLLYIIGKMILKHQKRTLIENCVPQIFIIIGLSLNFTNIIPGIFLAFLMGLLFQISLLLMHKPNKNVSITPFLILAPLIIKIFTLFPFYDNFLNVLHLI